MPTSCVWTLYASQNMAPRLRVRQSSGQQAIGGAEQSRLDTLAAWKEQGYDLPEEQSAGSGNEIKQLYR